MGNQAGSLGAEVEYSLNHPRMRQVSFAKNNEVMRARMSVEDENQFFAWENRLARLKKFDEYYLLLPKAYEFSKKGVCGSSGVIAVEYDNYPYLLQEEIRNRAQAGNFFAETELWYLLYGLVSAASIFKEVGTKVGDIQSNSIFLNEVGQIKVSNLCSWPGEHTNYEKLVFQHLLTYVSPEELEQAKEGRVDIYAHSQSTQAGNGGKLDQYLCESFSIGLTMLEAALLKISAPLYEPREKSLDSARLGQLVGELLRNDSKTSYSRVLRMTIAGLCEVDVKKRLQALQVYEQLRLHDSQITNLKPCKIEIDVGTSKASYQKQMMESEPTKSTTINSINNYSSPNGITGTSSAEFHKPMLQMHRHEHQGAEPPLQYGNANTHLNNFSIPGVIPYAGITGGMDYGRTLDYTSGFPSTYGAVTNGTRLQPTQSTYYVPYSSSLGYVGRPTHLSALSKPAGLQIGSGNTYLQSIYSSEPASKTPTFTSMPGLPTPNNAIPLSYHTSLPTNAILKSSNTWQTYAPEPQQESAYRFSNISSIPKQVESDIKPHSNIEAFTPSKDGQDSGLDFLKKIEEEILKSKSKFSGQ